MVAQQAAQAQVPLGREQTARGWGARSWPSASDADCRPAGVAGDTGQPGVGQAGNREEARSSRAHRARPDGRPLEPTLFVPLAARDRGTKTVTGVRTPTTMHASPRVVFERGCMHGV